MRKKYGPLHYCVFKNHSKQKLSVPNLQTAAIASGWLKQVFASAIASRGRFKLAKIVTC